MKEDPFKNFKETKKDFDFFNNKKNVLDLINNCIIDGLIPKEEGEEILIQAEKQEKNFSVVLNTLFDLLQKRYEALLKLFYDDPSLDKKKISHNLKAIEDLHAYYYEKIQARKN